jgi:hypothetical protein
MKPGNVAAGGCKEREALVPVSRDDMVAAEDSDPACVHPNYRSRIAGLDNWSSGTGAAR